ncbi:autotransporter outer membrane beta-barrel domain-containing protein [Escherichia coli]|uniref:autotransporter outer membrane beta-barrel domain-containing protein n=1 Tax=Escherichia coli TaxID=562 RepID=UPI000DE8FF78|nr:S6 family peptidase [Escherichia coli]EHH6062823.1 autotransporter outer membrane beta-barrel domain-containing protein [Escherichia coli]QRT17065.1 autotransporter outer membrane beta-barrel domain-containing protein [Escherichia coli]RBW00122.1 autotransporter outer membrane beta-barrel domain-containing protein [Escherichia coli]
MNKIYSLKYSHITGGLVAVSELAKKSTIKTGKKIIIATMLVVSSPALSSTVSAEIPYQTFRDFAENKGVFIPGTTNINITNKSGATVGSLQDPMIDFSSVSKQGSITLISPGFAVSAKHGGLSEMKNASFGYEKNNYNITGKNIHSSLDFSLFRFDKLITESTGTDINTTGKLNNKSQYTSFYRSGSGTQYVKDTSGKQTHITGSFLTGGTVGTPWYSGGQLISSTPGDTFNKAQGPLASYGQLGDSGSPLFAYDSINKEWKLVGVTLHNYGVNGKQNNWLLIPVSYIKDSIKSYFDQEIIFNNAMTEPMIWSYDSTKGTGYIQQGNTRFSMHGKLNNNANAGKNLYFSGENGKIELQNNVDQGAGYLQFNNNYTVVTNNNSTWQGAGIIVNPDTTVTWGINGVKGDELHKTGKGTLIINGSGENKGSLKIGDGTVILKQQKQNNISTAFSAINISGGNSLVKLDGDNQVNPDNISWGYRGGALDINGKNITFSRLNASDYGAAIINTNNDKSILTLNLSPLNKSEITIPVRELSMNAIFMGGYGTPGEVYKTTFNGPVQYYILKKQKFGSVIMGSLKNNQEWLFVGTNVNQAIEKAKDLKIQNSAQQSYIYHGKFDGNLDINIPALAGNDVITFDGAVNITGDIDKKSGSMIFQGHPVIHADKSVSTAQTDWEDRHFSFNKLKLDNVDFSLSRNAHMTGDIEARNNSLVTIGGDKVYVDKNDGTGESIQTQGGKNASNNTVSYIGNITLSENSDLHLNSKFTGEIMATDSKITVNSPDAVLDRTTLINTPVFIENMSHVTSRSGLYSNKAITLSDSKLTITGHPDSGEQNQYTPSIVIAEAGFNLSSDNSVLEGYNYTSISGDITSEKHATVNFGTSESSAVLSENASVKLSTGLLAGFNMAYRGVMNLPFASVNMNNIWWQITDNSKIKSLQIKDTFTQFFSGNKGVFNTLEIDNMTANNSAFVMRSDTQKSDQLIVKNKLEGGNNLLLVDFIEKNGNNKNGLNIDLVKAPADTSKEIFKTETRSIGFSNVTPEIKQHEKDGQSVWTLTGYKTVANTSAVTKATSLMSGNYKAFLNEVNNLNKRMGDLRDINGEAGAWARIMSGAGSAGGGYSDNYTHVQIGADKKHELDGLDLFTGMTMTYTDSNAGNNDFSGKTKSVGAGLYASAMFESGAYIDLIGKYVHHDNEYTASFAGLGTKNYSSHSWYAGAEVGYRYHVTDDAWIEPQAELVYGAVSGKQFTWKDQGMSLSMKDKDFNPLIGRTGIDVGKTFSGKDWKVTARAGLGYQFDILANSETVLRDASGEKRIKGEKDGRMLMNVGLNAEIRDNLRFGLEFEKSAFGKYNVDNAVNASFRYSF